MDHRSTCEPIVGLLLAAGSSRRFGANKLMQCLPDGVWVAVQACRTLLAGTDRVLAVVRTEEDALGRALESEGADVVAFEQADQGMGASLAFGVSASPDAGGWIVALADMPWLRVETVRAVADALRSGAGLAAPCRDRRRGHPVGFSSAFGGELMNLRGDQGARTIVDAHGAELRLLETGDPGIFRDIDTPADLLSDPVN